MLRLSTPPTIPPVVAAASAAAPAAPLAASAAASPAVSAAALAAASPAASAAASTAPSSANSKSAYASKAKDLQSNTNNWITIERKRKKISPVTGSGEASVLEGVAIEKPRKDYWEIGVSRLKADCTQDLLKSHLHGKNIEVKEVFVFPSKIKGTVSAKIRVALEHKERALDAASWPPLVRISSWINKPKSAKRNDATRREQAQV